jgi:peptidylprolyl isomerase
MMIGSLARARPIAAAPRHMLQQPQRLCAVQRWLGSNSGGKQEEVVAAPLSSSRGGAAAPAAAAAAACPKNESKPPTPTSTAKRRTDNSWMWPVASIAAMGVTYVLMERAMHPDVVTTSNPPTKLKPAPPQAEITDRAYFDITIDGNAIGRIVLGLHGTVAPKTVANFLHLCQGDRYENNNADGSNSTANVRLAYENSSFHRIIPHFMIQGGDFTHHNGTGGRSIYGRSFADETFALRHHVGVVSMANSGRNTNGSQFFIAVASTPHLDNKHVVFGTVVEGWEVVKAIEDCGSASGRPNGQVKIAACGILPNE